MDFLEGKKTYILVAIALLAQWIGAAFPQYSVIANYVSAGALSLTPATIRSAVETLKNGQ